MKINGKTILSGLILSLLLLFLPGGLISHAAQEESVQVLEQEEEPGEEIIGEPAEEPEENSDFGEETEEELFAEALPGEEETGEPAELEAAVAPALEEAENEEDFANYVETLFGAPQVHHEGEPEMHSTMLFSNRTTRGSRLSQSASPQIADLYERLVPKIKAVAAGEEEASLFTFSFKELGLLDLRGYVTPQEGETDAEVRARARKELDALYTYNKTKDGAPMSNIRYLLTALTGDLPAELYWFDKTTSMLILSSDRLGTVTGTLKDGRVYARYITLGENNQEDKENPPYLRVCLWASSDYATEEQTTLSYVVQGTTKTVSGYTHLDSGKTGAAAKALSNAEKVLEEGAGKATDLDRLQYFREYILNAVSYNYAAWSSSYQGGYGDPWQLIYVFDEDPETNVVCEGYSKAFQYLVDSSDFADSTIYSNLANGSLNNTGESNNHMWNLVHIGEENYLVDLTNDDTGKEGVFRGYFLIGASVEKEGENSWLRASPTGLSNRYLYNSDMSSIYSGAELKVSQASYGEHTWEEVSEDGEGVRRWNAEEGVSEQKYRCPVCGETIWMAMAPQPHTRITPSWQTRTLNAAAGELSAELTWSTWPEYANPEVSWVSMTPALASVSREGDTLTITPRANGTALIRGRSASGEECYVNLTNKGIKPVTGLKLYTLSGDRWKTGNIKADLAKAEEGEDTSLYVSLQLLPANATFPEAFSVEWTSSNEQVCAPEAVSESGFDGAPGEVKLLTLKEPGIATITAKYGAHLKAQLTVTVLSSATSLEIMQEEDNRDEDIVLYPGESLRLRSVLSLVPTTDTGAVSYSSGNTKVAKITTTGLLTAVGPGDTTITAKLKNGLGKLLTAEVDVSVPEQEVKNVQGDSSFKLSLSKSSVSLSYYDYSHLTEEEDRADSLVLTASVPKAKAQEGIEWGIVTEQSELLELETVSSGEDFSSKGKASVLLTPLGSAGVGYVYAQVGENRTYCRVEVKKPVTGLVLVDDQGEEPTSLELSYGEYKNLRIKLLPEDTTDNRQPSLKSTKSSVKVYGGRGIQGGALTMNAKGVDEPAEVYAALGAVKSSRIAVSVTDEPAALLLNKSELTIKAGGTATLSASLLPSVMEKGKKDRITWSIGKNEDESESGIVFQSGESAAGGTVKLITSAAAGGSFVRVTASYERKDGVVISAYCLVSVTKPVSSLKLLSEGTDISGTSFTHSRSENSFSLPAVLTQPEDATTSTAPVWTSGNKSLLTIDSSGQQALIPSGAKSGKVKLTAKSGGKSAYIQVELR